ncbi:hypothetical protein PAHAL_9G577100 [Panicum hallii]|uniref:VPS37 C-terminal domain-containing protein n=1 Tax=Panicum hallii TaxID=206008 RepID=A0A2T8I655_9POAL|nr:hypothetical protein PAHAL_9G577100 [Panicum hallii]
MVAAGRRRRAVMAGVVTPRQRAESKQLPLVPLLPFFPVGRGAAPAAATSWGADGIPALASPLATRSRTPAANPPTPSLRSCRSHRLRPAGRELLQAAPPRLRRGLALPVFLIVPEAHDELTKETLQLARKNLEKEQRILELRNQVQHCHLHLMKKDRLTDLERQKDDIMRFYSPAALLDKLQTSMAKLDVDEESKELHQSTRSSARVPQAGVAPSRRRDIRHTAADTRGPSCWTDDRCRLCCILARSFLFYPLRGPVSERSLL